MKSKHRQICFTALCVWENLEMCHSMREYIKKHSIIEARERAIEVAAMIEKAYNRLKANGYADDLQEHCFDLDVVPAVLHRVDFASVNSRGVRVAIYLFLEAQRSAE